MKSKFAVFMTALLLAAFFFPSAVSAEATLLSKDKPVTASSSQSGNEVANINDGNDDTRWCASGLTYPQDVVIDLEGWYDISEIEIYFYRPDWDNNRHYDYKLFSSIDGEAYTLFEGGDFTSNTNTDRRVNHALTGTARFVKIELYSCSSETGWATISEMSVYGSPTAQSIFTVTEVETLPRSTVDFGTPLSALGLPEKTSVKLSDGSVLEAALTWNSDIYNPNEAGTYNLVGTLTGLPAGVTAPDGMAVRKTVVVRDENYTPPVVTRDTVSLCENWSFFDGSVTGGQNTLLDDSAWENVDLPHTWNAYQGLGGDKVRKGDGWYRKTVFIPEEKYTGRVFIEFDAAYSATTLYVNGSQVGDTHYGGYTRFRYDVTDYLNFGADNLFAVKVNSAENSVPPVSGDFTRFGGITGNVSLIYTNNIHADLEDLGSPGVHFTPERIGETTSWNLGVKASIVNDGTEIKTLTVKTVLRDIESFEPIPGIPESLTPFDESSMFGDNVYAEGTSSITVPAGEKAELSTSLTIENPRLWNGRRDPFRYAADLEIYDGDVLVDRVTQNIGFRYFSIDPDEGFFLNGEKYPLRGVGYHEDYIGVGSAMKKEHWDESFAMVYEMGASAVRLVHYPHDPYSYELCDKYGIVAWTELAQISWLNENDATYFERAKTELRELIRQQKNHPSICFWGIQNEVGVGRNEPWSDAVDDFMNELCDIVRKEDPTRFSTQASCNWNICGKEWLTDLIAINTYPLWYAKGNLGTTTDDYLANNIENPEYPHWNGKSLGVSEYGAGSSVIDHSEFPTQPVTTGDWHPEEWASIAHESAIKAINERDYLWFTSVWCMFDFASAGRNEGDEVGINDKGLVTRDRTVKKDAFYLYKANWAPAEYSPFVYITSRRKYEREVASNTVTVYSNLDSVELFANGVSLGLMTGEGDGIFRMENVSFGNVGDETVFTARSGEVSDSVTWKRVESDNIDIDVIGEGIYINEEDMTVLLSGAFTAADLNAMFSSKYNASFSVVASDLVTEVTEGAIEPGMRIKVTSESGNASKMYAVISTSIAKGKPVTASSESGTNKASMAVDGIISTDAGCKWDASLNDSLFPGAWLTVDLEKEYTLTKTKINFFPGWSKTRKYKYNIYVGSTADDLTLVVDRSENTEVGEIDDLLGGIKGRYVKVEILTNSDYEGGNVTALPSILEIEINGYNITSESAVFDHENKTVTIPAGEVYPSELLSQIEVDGNAILSVEAQAYYLMQGDKLVVTDYAGGRTEYTVCFAEAGESYIAVSTQADVDLSKKDTVTFAVMKSNTALIKYLEDNDCKYEYIGDINKDGSIDYNDLAEYLRSAARGGTLPSNAVTDIDKNGKVGLTDIRELMRMLLGAE